MRVKTGLVCSKNKEMTSAKTDAEKDREIEPRDTVQGRTG